MPSRRKPLPYTTHILDDLAYTCGSALQNRNLPEKFSCVYKNIGAQIRLRNNITLLVMSQFALTVLIIWNMTATNFTVCVLHIPDPKKKFASENINRTFSIIL